ncbi:dipeptide/tripeptide permease [Parabacteroides sp. PF5-5]|uniref:MFS transporter n=1 Tax=unclassified Parabacteroides TaxID=2649774 RepID=UPI00247337A7|nr:MULTISPECIES: MFS transporter [unclassified Parabacteroides]MDH6304384.1 dipeptide/tripeptide permease [Parabacteroides sp. PH5-39]MDH6315463.1 dipeptide/tripeptide permease [Parabacteroides sp. PF5-13]MDH6319043.1 dipeptide/tripeptide permease [Parabacteroides sp. PH5-13]MDH6322773.1 dipeptide/tripeptide permease [Parabacteroides sp. PH5-8]MDH6326655.1 dipeptide/tripeptide permease [Parabacteroides sp. PH5-41]
MSGIKFSQSFWVANVVELFERAAYYGVFIVITLYLSRILGFNDIQAAAIAGTFSAGLYLLPTFAGALADKIGFRSSMLLAFTLLTLGYAGLGIFPTMLESAGLVEYSMTTKFTGLVESNARYGIIPIMVLIVVGGSFIKSVISGTVAKETTPENRAKGFSIFYSMVNIGSFSGKTIVKPLREAMGNEGLINLNYFSATMTFLALLAIFFFYKSTQHSGEGKTFRQIWQALVKVCANGRLVALIIIITGFWIVQQQLYATMPKYVLRLAGEGASPSWYANVNPLVVVLAVNFVTQLMRKYTALTSMTLGMFIMPISALCMAYGNVLDGSQTILGMHPVAFMMVVGIVFQGLAETFISPRYLEYFSLQAPKGEEGLYLGFSHLDTFLSSIIGFGLSGYLLNKYCPEPTLFATHDEWVAASANAHYIWYYFGAIALISAFALIIYGIITKRLDASKKH